MKTRFRVAQWVPGKITITMVSTIVLLSANFLGIISVQLILSILFFTHISKASNFLIYSILSEHVYKLYNAFDQDNPLPNRSAHSSS